MTDEAVTIGLDDDRIKFFADRLLEVARIKAATEPYEGECDQEDLASYAGEVVKLRRALLASRAELAAAQQREAALSDPICVHVNMLRGTIAKPTIEQIIHLYGVDALCKALAPVIVREAGNEQA